MMENKNVWDFLNFTILNLSFYTRWGAATGVVLLKKVFLKISQNLQENTRARVSF